MQTDKLRVMIMGPSHSGTRLVTAFLSLHNALSVGHMSFPGPKRWPAMGDDRAGQNPNPNKSKVVLVARDRTCNAFSMHNADGFTRNKEQRLKEAGLDHPVDAAVRAINQYLSTMPLENIVVVSYEALLLHKELVLRQTFRLLGVNEDDYDYNYDGPVKMAAGWINKDDMKLSDGNAKYFRQARDGTLKNPEYIK